ncbi:mersacidin family lantibiotic [Cytobacillus gottheilii]|uniref:mersacidin family lantibiotic n=1 Tax=Cytobacillus gottheilii TaxID=859144 RepID=UPI0009B97C22|nr:mersacidin family lantibiotic [Cytobacillus gottheilii]
MNSEEIISNWKKTENRSKLENHPSGSSFNELAYEEMLAVCGGSGVAEPQATPTIALTSALVGAPVSAFASLTITAVFCK